MCVKFSKLVSTASVAAYEGQIGQAAYSASKGGSKPEVSALFDRSGSLPN